MICINVGNHEGLLTKGKDYKVRRAGDRLIVMSDRGFPCTIEAECFDDGDVFKQPIKEDTTEILTQDEAKDLINKVFDLLYPTENQDIPILAKKDKVMDYLSQPKVFKPRVVKGTDKIDMDELDEDSKQQTESTPIQKESTALVIKEA